MGRMSQLHAELHNLDPSPYPRYWAGAISKALANKGIVKCSHCGIETDNQPQGDGCHSCFRGYMKEKGT